MHIFMQYRFGIRAGNYRLGMESCCQYWNACLTLVADAHERSILHKSMQELVTLSAKSFEETNIPNVRSVRQDSGVITALYGIVFQAYTDVVNQMFLCFHVCNMNSIFNDRIIGLEVFRLLRMLYLLCLKISVDTFSNIN